MNADGLVRLGLVRFYRAEVLDSYEAQPQKYDVEFDYFIGRVGTRSSFFEETAQGTGQNSIGVKFGFHRMRNNDLALAVWLPDLQKATPDECRKWEGFVLDRQALSTNADPRFELWIDYVNGSWDLPEPVLARIKRAVSEINAIVECACGKTLFKFPDNPALRFPKFEHDHAYQDACAEAYKYLVDGLDKSAIAALAGMLGNSINVNNDNTLDALARLLPPQIQSSVCDPFKQLVSPARRSSAHGVRSAAQPFQAFQEFKDTMECVWCGLEKLRDWLACELKVSVDSCTERIAALRRLPKICSAAPLPANCSIYEAMKVQGKTVSEVRVGVKATTSGASDRELIQIHFDDGTILALETLSNISELLQAKEPFSAEALRIQYWLTFVPPIRKP